MIKMTTVDNPGTDSYRKLWFVDILHYFPHVNFSFEVTNNTFSPESISYKESLVFLFSLPVILVVLTLLVTSCCLCLQCVRKPPTKNAGSTCLRIALFIFILLSIGVLAPGFYGNEQTGKGVDSFATSVQNTNETLTDALYSLDILERLTDSISTQGVNALNTVIGQYIGNTTARNSLISMAQKIKDKSDGVKKNIISVRGSTPNISLQYISEDAYTFEFYRWIGTVVLMCFTVFVLLVMLLAVWKKSKCLLMFSVFLGFLSLLLVWGGSGVYLAGSVAAADLCYDPDAYIESSANGTLDSAILKVYLECPLGTTQPPSIATKINDATTAVRQANVTLTKIFNQSLPFNITSKLQGPVKNIRQELGWAMGNVTHLAEDLDCRNVHKNYITAVKAICHTSLMGVMFVLLSLPVTGFLMIFIQCMLPRLWRLSGKRKGAGYRPVDDTDPFCPRPPPYNGYGSIHEGVGASGSVPHTRSYSLNDRESESLPMTGPPTGSPPPAYRPTGTFVDDYNLRSEDYNYRTAT